MQMNIPLDMERECWACETTGKATDARWSCDDAGTCENCNGIGYELTDLGKSVIDMLSRHAPGVKK